MTGKYSDPIAETADAIVGDGFEDAHCGTVEYGGEHYALVTLYADALWADDDARADRLAAYRADRAPSLLKGSRVIIRTDAQGFVDTYYGPAHPLGDPPAYAALLRAWAEIEADDAAMSDEADTLAADIDARHAAYHGGSL